jgi:protein-S-isoprenylcysteine O-methyltransferase Ste14
MNSFIIKYTLAIVILAVLVLLVRGDFFSSAPLVIIGQLAAVALLASSRMAFGSQEFGLSAEPRQDLLVRRGPYKFIRHPMYAGALLLIWVSILGHWSILNFALGIIVLAFALLRIALEEELLREHYAEYEEYARQTKKIIPFVY